MGDEYLRRVEVVLRRGVVTLQEPTVGIYRKIVAPAEKEGDDISLLVASVAMVQDDGQRLVTYQADGWLESRADYIEQLSIPDWVTLQNAVMALSSVSEEENRQ